MIVTLLDGGIGNQLFQYAAGRRLAKKLKTKLKLDLRKCEAEKSLHHGAYRLNNFNIEESFATEKDFQKNLQVIKENPGAKIPGVFMPEVLNLPDNIFLSGWWQSEKYFADIEKIIRREFTLKNPLHKISSQWKEKILSAENPVSLHIRHGDYLTPMWRNHTGVLPMDYYITCVNEFKKFLPNFTLFVFSDDLAWAEKNLNFGVPIEFVKGCEIDVEELYLMSLCKHNITANSSFSWWGAWLNKNPNKKVFSPYPWHKRGWGGDTIIPESWNKIPVDFNKNPHVELPQTLSIILFAENGLQQNQIAMSSVMSVKNAEVIIIDSSNDGTEKFLRQFAANENVNFLKVSNSTEKYSAWNMGIDCARGEYILFLTSQDFIMAETEILLNQILFNQFQTRSKISGEYVNSDNYGEENPNIICSAQRLEEDNLGTINIPVLPNKKFSLKIDEVSKNLNGVTDLKLDTHKKLAMLGTQQVNSSFSTKFFKRKFLTKYNIRFNLRIPRGGDIGIIFLTEIFLKTENIIFIPQCFSGHLIC